jgi:hypothetical protein
MWQVDNRTPFAVDSDWVRDRDGADVWLVAVKATFDIAADGSVDVSKVQPPVLRVPEYHGDAGTSSIKYDCDLVLTKTTTDILVVGHAHAPQGLAVRELDVGFQVGTTRKILKVFGDRTWGALGVSDPVPFLSMPLIYERAFGGIDNESGSPERDWDWCNPVGCGFAVANAHLHGMPVANVEMPGQFIRSWDDRPEPAGFGVIASHWKSRAAFAGTYGPRWEEIRQPLLPEDFDDRFFQSAPADQQAPQFLTGGESVALVNLSAHGRLRFLLPKLYLGFDTHFYDGSRELHKVRRLHTVILEPDFPRVSLVWHSALPCHHKPYKLDRTLVTLKQDFRTGERISEEEDLEFM